MEKLMTKLMSAMMRVFSDEAIQKELGPFMDAL